MSNRRQMGTAYEEMAARYLTICGYRVLEHSFRCRIGEIDLIAVDTGRKKLPDRQPLIISTESVESVYARSRNGDADSSHAEEAGGHFPEDACLVFVEVKYRRTAVNGMPEEAVSPRKQSTISRVADFYRMKKGIHMYLPCRFDVIAIEGETLRHWRNAFPYTTHSSI